MRWKSAQDRRGSYHDNSSAPFCDVAAGVIARHCRRPSAGRSERLPEIERSLQFVLGIRRGRRYRDQARLTPSEHRKMPRSGSNAVGDRATAGSPSKYAIVEVRRVEDARRNPDAVPRRDVQARKAWHRAIKQKTPGRHAAAAGSALFCQRVFQPARVFEIEACRRRHGQSVKRPRRSGCARQRHQYQAGHRSSEHASDFLRCINCVAKFCPA